MSHDHSVRGTSHAQSFQSSAPKLGPSQSLLVTSELTNDRATKTVADYSNDATRYIELNKGELGDRYDVSRGAPSNEVKEGTAKNIRHKATGVFHNPQLNRMLATIANAGSTAA